MNRFAMLLFVLGLVICLNSNVAALDINVNNVLDVKLKGQLRISNLIINNRQLGVTKLTNHGTVDSDVEDLRRLYLRFRFEPEFRLSEDIVIKTRMDALDCKPYGYRDDKLVKVYGYQEDDRYNFDFDRAWLEWDTPIGQLKIGRGSPYKNPLPFLDLSDDEESYDQIQWKKKFGEWTTVLNFTQLASQYDYETEVSRFL